MPPKAVVSPASATRRPSFSGSSSSSATPAARPAVKPAAKPAAAAAKPAARPIVTGLGGGRSASSGLGGKVKSPGKTTAAMVAASQAAGKSAKKTAAGGGATGGKEAAMKAKEEPTTEEKKEEPEMSEEEKKARVALCRYDEDQDEALSMRELANLIRDVLEDECKFCEDNQVGGFIKKQMTEWDKDGDRKLNAAEFIPWYGQFRAMIDGVGAREKEKKEREAAQKSAALAGMFDKMHLGEVCECLMPELPMAIELCLQIGKTPLLLDHTVAVEEEEFSPLEVFYSYSNDAIIEMKKYVVLVNMKKEKTAKEALEEMRKVVIGAMKYGKDLVVLMSNCAPPITSQFNSPEEFPLALLDAKQVAAVRTMAFNEWPEESFLHQLVDFDKDKVSVVHKDFKVVVVTKFQAEDFRNFLKDELPIGLMQPIRVLTVGQK